MADKSHTVRGWALVAVAASSTFTIAISVWLISILSTQDWCTRALGAAKYAEGRPESAIQACFNLMNSQVDTLGTALLISIGVQALALLVLVVIVLAGAQLALKAGKSGVDLNMSKEGEAAHKVADAAVEKAEEIEGEEL